MTATNYLDLAGLQRFKTKLDTQYAGIYRTETQVNDQIDTKLATFSQNYVQIVSDIPTIAGGAKEGIIYLVPDSNAQQGTFAYVAYAVETVSGEPKVVRIGAGTTVLPTVDQTIVEDSTNAVAGGAVFDGLALKVNLADVTGSVTQNDTNPVTSGGVYTKLQEYVTTASIASSVTDGDTNAVSGNAVYDHVASVVDNYVEESRVTSDAPASASTDICTSGAMFTALGLKVNESRVTSSAPADDSTDICTSGAVYDALDLKVDKSSIVDAITDGSMSPVTSNAVYDALAEIQSVSNDDIDALFAPASSGD